MTSMRTKGSTAMALLNLGALSALLMAGCGPAEIDELEQTAAPIVGGPLDHGHPAVGKVFGGNGLCSGTLIGVRTVLTAARCVKGATEAWSFFDDGAGYGRPIPHSYDAQGGGDLAVIRLQRPITTVRRRPLCGAAPSRRAEVTVVGYTLDHTSDGAGIIVSTLVKHQARARISNVVGPTTFDSSPSDGTRAHLSRGDWGGPALLGGCVAGVATRKVATKCLAYPCHAPLVHSRVDIFREWITRVAGDPTIQWQGGPPVCSSRERLVCSSGREGGCHCESWN